MSLQLATSQYGVEFSTPQPRILIAKKTKKTKSIGEEIASWRNTNHGRQGLILMCVCKHLSCTKGNQHTRWKLLLQDHSYKFQSWFVLHQIELNKRYHHNVCLEDMQLHNHRYIVCYNWVSFLHLGTIDRNEKQNDKTNIWLWLTGGRVLFTLRTETRD